MGGYERKNYFLEVKCRADLFPNVPENEKGKKIVVGEKYADHEHRHAPNSGINNQVDCPENGELDNQIRVGIGNDGDSHAVVQIRLLCGRDVCVGAHFHVDIDCGLVHLVIIELDVHLHREHVVLSVGVQLNKKDLQGKMRAKRWSIFRGSRSSI